MTEDRLFKGMSNKTLVVLLSVIMLLALVGTFYTAFNNKITGFATSQGTVEVRVQAYTSINVNNNVYFGNGTISNNPLNLTSISTEVNNNLSTTFNNCNALNGNVSDAARDCTGMEIENNGNVFVNVTFASSKTVASFFDSVSDIGANFAYGVLDGNRSKKETAQTIMGFGYAGIGATNASCKNNMNNLNISILPQKSYLDGSYMNWTAISTSTQLICGNLSFGDGNDTITVEFNLTFPADEPIGLKSNTFTFTALQLD